MTRLRLWTNASMLAVADFLWPPACPSCAQSIGTHGRLCVECWDALTFIGPPQCAVCGLPFPYDVGQDARCADCLRARPPYTRARAALAYDNASRDIILPFKHADRTDLAEFMATLMMRAARPLLADADVIVPVPLHYRRFVSRRYNQSALLAKKLGRRSKAAYAPHLLVRHRSTSSQGGKSRSSRRRNVLGAFRVPVDRRPNVRDKRVLLVDDVLTTGATVDACARALLRGGAASVDVITFARVLREGL